MGSKRSMELFCCTVALLCSISVASLEESGRAQERTLLTAWSTTLDHTTKDTPIQRVVKLLTEMKEQLEKEAEEDQVQYDKSVCWCETNDKEKTKAIADADSHMTDLLGEIESRAARDAELTVDIEHLKKVIAEETKALADATALREKEYGDFTDSEKETVQAITMLKNAVLVLGKHNAGLLQLTPAVEQSIGSVLQFAAVKHEEMIASKAAGLSLLQRSSWARVERASSNKATSSLQTDMAAESRLVNMMRNALQGRNGEATALPAEYAAQVLAKAAAEGTAFVQQPVAVKSYEPQSGQIFGILNQMKEEFETNLGQSQKEEEKAQQEYNDMKAAKEEQIAATKKMNDEKSTEMWANKKALTDAKEDLETTSAQFKADKKFLSDLRLVCQKLDHDWAERSKARSNEITAVAETISILTSDDARDMLHKTVTLLQMQSRRSATQASKKLRNDAAAVLRKAAQEMDPFGDDLAMWNGQMRPAAQLSALATKVSLDAFTKIKEAMDKMIADLKEQQSEEVKLKEFCNKELNENEKQTYTTTEHLKDLTTKIENLEATIATLEAEIVAAKEEIATTQVELKHAGEGRKAENQEFQVTVSDQRATQAILKKAMARMNQFYAGKGFLQQKQPAPPGGGFTKHKKNAGGNVIISFLEQIIEDSVKVENEAITAEQEAQAAYAEFVNDSTASIQALQEAITAKADNIASATAEKENAEMEKTATEEQLESLHAYAGDLHEQCDYTLKNFDLRQGARLKEIEAIQEAKAILSGMK